jgi:hypothetical protein
MQTTAELRRRRIPVPTFWDGVLAVVGHDPTFDLLDDPVPGYVLPTRAGFEQDVENLKKDWAKARKKAKAA